MSPESRRGRRRRLTETIAARRREEFVSRLMDGDEEAHRWARTSPHYWAKNAVGCCRCVKRRHGRPREDQGICNCGARSRIYQLRAQTRELRNLVVGHDVNYDSDEVALLSSPHPEALWR